MPRHAALLVLVAFLLSCARAVDPASSPTAVDEPRPTPPTDIGAARLLARGATFVAVPRENSLEVHAAPGTERPYLRLDAHNPWGQRLRLLVMRSAIDDGDVWLRIQLPIWPNGQAGWIAASAVRLAEVADRVLIDVSDRRLVRLRDGEPMARLPVAVGSSRTPTPPGRYFVWAKVETDRPSGPYGSFILGLSGFSDSIEPWKEFPGEPRLAIHGTDDPADAGRAVSKGCVRVSNGLLRHLRGVPMGTPVVIRA